MIPVTRSKKELQKANTCFERFERFSVNNEGSEDPNWQALGLYHILEFHVSGTRTIEQSFQIPRLSQALHYTSHFMKPHDVVKCIDTSNFHTHPNPFPQNGIS